MTSKFSFLLFLFILPLALAQLKNDFYKDFCPGAESIIRKVVENQFSSNKSITPALLRLQFHDCFVEGCDASILIDTTDENDPSEKDAGPNKTVRGYDLIDEAKEELEKQCPSTVSCADIIIVATRDAVALAGGPFYNVTTGRRDGRVSKKSQVNLPSPSLSVAQTVELFKDKNFSAIELVTLLGGHTVGIAHCENFQDRLNSNDPTMTNKDFEAQLTRTCASGSNAFESLDQGTPSTLDNEFYNQILLGKGVLKIDQEIALDGSTNKTVSLYKSNLNKFQKDFANAMIKLGTTDVLVGDEGEIRKNCRVINQNQDQKKNDEGNGFIFPRKLGN